MQHNRLSPLALALSLALSACQPPVVQSPRQNSFKTLSTQSGPEPYFLPSVIPSPDLALLPHRLNPETDGKEPRKPEPEGIQSLGSAEKWAFQTQSFDPNQPDMAQSYPYIPLDFFPLVTQVNHFKPLLWSGVFNVNYFFPKTTIKIPC